MQALVTAEARLLHSAEGHGEVALLEALRLNGENNGFMRQIRTAYNQIPTKRF